MSSYRRVWQEGGTYFFTVNILDRKSDLFVRHIDALREAIRQVKNKRIKGAETLKRIINVRDPLIVSIPLVFYSKPKPCATQFRVCRVISVSYRWKRWQF